MGKIVHASDSCADVGKLTDTLKEAKVFMHQHVMLGIIIQLVLSPSALCHILYYPLILPGFSFVLHSATVLGNTYL